MDAVLLAGPTASGKSELALMMAERIGGALVNIDSMQVYRDVRILTARPRDADLMRAPHFLYGHVGLRDAYSAARYQGDAIAALAEARARGRVPIFVGGTGLYFGAMIDGLADVPPVPDGVREAIRRRRTELGADAFFAELVALDPDGAARLRASDTQRVLRVREVFEASGRSLSHWQRSSGVAPFAGMSLARFVLSPHRPELHRRIDARFETMLASGALAEAASLRGIDAGLPAAKILGLRELWQVVEGTSDLEGAKAAAKAATRQYAKRQLTWFRHRMADWTWFEAGGPGEIVEQMLKQL